MYNKSRSCSIAIRKNIIMYDPRNNPEIQNNNTSIINVMKLDQFQTSCIYKHQSKIVY